MSSDFLYKDETYEIIGICMEVHTILGHGFLEIVYKDAIEYEVAKRKIEYSREEEFSIPYKDITLPHKFYADFILFDRIILEVKSNEEGFADAHVSQMINYLKVSGCKIGLLINFGKAKLEYKRVIL